MPSTPLPTAFHVMTKPIGPICNLDCRYCFYLEKEDLYRSDRSARPSWQMPDDILESYIRQYIETQDRPEIDFAWQGGEPTLLGVRFFERVVELQQHYANGKVVRNAFQTNGTLLDDRWGEFLARNGFLVGVSIDGPRELHDHYRVDKKGGPTFDRVLAGIRTLKRHGVDFNTLTVVNRVNSQHPAAVYRFLKEIGSGFLQFIPLVERAAAAPIETKDGLIQLALASPPKTDSPRSPVTEWSVRSEDYGTFLCTIYDQWVRADVGRTFVQMFDVTLGNWVGAGPTLCVFAPKCGAALAMEHNGDVYSCDHYVYPEYHLGNLREKSLADMVASEAQRAFGDAKESTLPRYCRDCDVRFACHGECPKHRFLRTPDGEFGLNYLCAGYKKYFHHAAPTMNVMAELLRRGEAPARVMEWMAARERARAKVGRNDPCPCGSGRKFKACCGR